MNLQLSSKMNVDNPYHVYYDLDVINNSSRDQSVQLRFKETRQNPYLNAVGDYFMSIVRFDIQTVALPVFCPIMQIGSITDTIYGLQVSSTDPLVDSWNYITYIPQVYVSSPPVAGQPQDLENSYYHVKDYNFFLELINGTLSAAWGMGPVPFFSIDSTTFNITFNYPVGETKSVYLNSALYNLLSTLPINKQYRNNSFSNVYKLAVNTLAPLRTIAAPSTINVGSFYQMVSENTPLSQWNPIKSIVFNGFDIPIASTNIAPVEIYGSTANVSISGNKGLSANTNIQNNITDFVVPFNAQNTYKPYISYIPTAEYRLSDFSQHNPLVNIDIIAYWKDKYNNIHPLYLDPFCSASLKILFRRKDFNISYN